MLACVERPAARLPPLPLAGEGWGEGGAVVVVAQATCARSGEEQSLQLGAGVFGAHERFSDEERVHAGRAHARDIIAACECRFR